MTDQAAEPLSGEPTTEAGCRYVNGSLADMIKRYGTGWSLRTVIVDIEHEAATRASAGPGLDVERLATTLHNLQFGCHRDYRGDVDCLNVGWHSDGASRFTAEYARLGAARLPVIAADIEGYVP